MMSESAAPQVEKQLFYEWPPFPEAPVGVTLIPFKKFEAKGIFRVKDPLEEVEYDAEGVVTIKLAVEHGSLVERAAREKAKRARKRQRAAAAGLTEAEMGEERMQWYEIWEDLEPTLAPSEPVNPMANRIDRYVKIMTDFQNKRKIPPSIQSIHDNFRLFTGLVAKNPVGVAKKAKAKAERKAAAEKEDQPMSDEDGDPTTFAADDNSAEIADSSGEEDVLDGLSEEERMDAFLDDPIKSMKVFLTSYYHEKGLAWSKEKLQDGPIVLKFIFEYMLRHRALPENERQFKQVLLLLEVATPQLLATQTLAHLLPDAFARACTELWGSENDRDVARGWAKLFPDGPPATGQDETMTDPVLESTTADLVRDALDVEINGQQMRVSDEVAENIASEAGGWGPPASSAWGNPSPLDNTGGWDVIGDQTDILPQPDEISPTHNEGDDNPSSFEPQPSWDPAPVDTAQFFHDTTFVDTHIIVRAERSTKQILNVELPNPGSPFILRQRLGVITLCPWKLPPNAQTSNGERSFITPPEVITNDVSSAVPLAAYDANETLIRVLFDPAFVDAAKPFEGMGIMGLWVQVAERNTSEGENTEEAPKKKSRSKGKSKTKAAEGDTPKTWWYLEGSSLIVPSFWTDFSEVLAVARVKD